MIQNFQNMNSSIKMEDRYLASLQKREISQKVSHNFAKDVDQRNVNRNSYSKLQTENCVKKISIIIK
jgi:hypothetical protein